MTGTQTACLLGMVVFFGFVLLALLVSRTADVKTAKYQLQHCAQCRQRCEGDEEDAG